MIPKKNSYTERRVGCSKVKLYGEIMNACRHCFKRGASPTNENLSFSVDRFVMRLKEHCSKRV